MSSVNKCILIGNLGADPDVRTTASGQLVATLSVATSESWTGKDGQRQEHTEWHRVVLWGKTAELAQRYLAKGRKVYVEGRIQTRKWDKDGVTHYSTEIVGQQMVFLDRGDGRSEERREQAGGREQQRQPAPGQEQAPEFVDGDVPF